MAAVLERDTVCKSCRVGGYRDLLKLVSVRVTVGLNFARRRRTLSVAREYYHVMRKTHIVWYNITQYKYLAYPITYTHSDYPLGSPTTLENTKIVLTCIDTNGRTKSAWNY